MRPSKYPPVGHRAVSDDEEQLSGRVIGSAIEVHRSLGPGFLESIYQEALTIQLALDGISHQVELEVSVPFKGREVGKQRLDFLVERQLVLELKSVADLSNAHKAQVRSYLKATGLRLGLLINFNQELLQVKRILND